jgi:hypothetical protein
MGPAAVPIAIIGGAAIGAYSSHKAREDAQDQFEFGNMQSATASFADADAAIAAAEAEAGAIMAKADAEAAAYERTAAAEAEAFQSQAEVERSVLYQAAEEARGIAYQNIEKMKLEADESLRRLESEQASWEGKAKARAAASGVRSGADTSTGMYIEGLENENQRQYDWLGESYRTGLDVASSTAESEYYMGLKRGDAASESGQIRARAALESGSAMAEAAREAGGAIAGATAASGAYYAEAMRIKGQSYLEGSGGSFARGLEGVISGTKAKASKKASSGASPGGNYLIGPQSTSYN